MMHDGWRRQGLSRPQDEDATRRGLAILYCNSTVSIGVGQSTLKTREKINDEYSG